MAVKKEKTTQREQRDYNIDLDNVRLTANQQKLYETILSNEVTFATGPAGTSKTFTAMYSALRLLSKGSIRKIILTKPIQESGEKLGYLPGNVDEKIAPYLESFMLTLKKIIPEAAVQELFAFGIIEFRPLAFMRGATFDNSLMILDEAQNTIESQLILYLTRLGNKSKILVMGDTNQIDIKEKDSAFENFIEMISDVKGVSHHQFGREDIVRNKMIVEITDRYDIWKSQHTQRGSSGSSGNKGR
jgi:phosphate starvation-inducible PhoH-like protein